MAMYQAHERTAPPIVTLTTPCDACGQPLGLTYYTMPDRPERFCAPCIDTRPRCTSCGVPVGINGWQLHDGRYQCQQCHARAIYDPVLARQLFDEIVQHLHTTQGLVLRVGVAFRLVDAPTIAAVRRATSERQHAPNPQEHLLGLYVRQRSSRAIYLLYGLPRLVFRTTVAHEYAHAWQGEHCPLLENTVLREGFAEWVAYRYLHTLGATRAAARMLQSNHPYRPMLEYVLELEVRLGAEGVLHFMRTAE